MGLADRFLDPHGSAFLTIYCVYVVLILVCAAYASRLSHRIPHGLSKYPPGHPEFTPHDSQQIAHRVLVLGIAAIASVAMVQNLIWWPQGGIRIGVLAWIAFAGIGLLLAIVRLRTSPIPPAMHPVDVSSTREQPTPNPDVPWIVRQGDVALIAVNDIPADAEAAARDTSGRVVLAQGEVTGHAHALHEPGVQLLRAANADVFLRVTQPASLRHEEHARIHVPPGIYRVLRQREYRPAREQPRSVED